MDFESSAEWLAKALEHTFNEERAFSEFKISVDYLSEHNNNFDPRPDISNFAIELTRVTDDKIIGHQYLFINNHCDIMFGKMLDTMVQADSQNDIYTWGEESWKLPRIERDKFCIFVNFEHVVEDERQKGYSKYLHWTLYTLVEFLCDPRKIHKLPAAIKKEIIAPHSAAPDDHGPYILLNDIFFSGEPHIKRYKSPPFIYESGLMGQHKGAAHEDDDLTYEYPYDFNAYYNDINKQMIKDMRKLKKELVDNIEHIEHNNALLHPAHAFPHAPVHAPVHVPPGPYPGAGAPADVPPGAYTGANLNQFLLPPLGQDYPPRPPFGGRRKRKTKKTTKRVRMKKQKKRTLRNKTKNRRKRKRKTKKGRK